MSLIAARSFLLGAYHDLPNVLFIGSLLFGSISGNLPLVWMAMGILFTTGITGILRAIFGFVMNSESTSSFARQIWRTKNPNCDIFEPQWKTGGADYDSKVLLAPSLWVSTTVFYAAFSIYNGIKILSRSPTFGASDDMLDARRAFSITVITTGILFALLIFARGFTGCESWFGTGLGVAIGIGCSIGFWHILDACGTGAMPDVHQVIGALAPPGSGKDIPVVCTPPVDPPR